MGPLWNQSTEEEQYLRENRTRFEQNLIAECMLKQGFEYIPNLNATVYFDNPSGSESARPDDIDWVTQYGYGIVSGITVGFDEFIPPPDPNAQLIESLSEPEKEAFYIALNGPLEARFPPGPIELSGPELRAARASQGCAGMAEIEAEDADPRELLNTDEFWPLQNAIAELWQSIIDSPELAILDSEWSNCMASQGHPSFAQKRDAFRKIMALNFAVRTGAGFEDNNANLAALNELREQEITLALVDLQCRESTNYWVRYNELRNQKEQLFIADNLPTLEALRDALEQRNARFPG